MAEPRYTPTEPPFWMDKSFAVWETSPNHFLVAVRNGAQTYRTNNLASVVRWINNHR